MTIAQQVQFQLSALGVPAPVATATFYSTADVLNPSGIGSNLSDDFVAPPHSLSPLVRASLEHGGLASCGQFLPGNGQ